MPGTSSSGGRNKKSQRAHALAGTGRKDRGTAKTETTAPPPDPPKGRPPIPTHKLTGEARAEWDRMADRLALVKTLTLVDDAVLYRYCQLHARAERLEREIAQLPTAFYIDHLGNEKVHPGFAQLRAHDQALRAYLVEFGMTPAARSRVTPSDLTKPPADPFAEFDQEDAKPH